MSSINRVPVESLPRDPNSRMHLVQFYSDDAFLMDTVAQFVASAIAEGGVGVLFATSDHLTGIADRLVARGVNVNSPQMSNRYFAFDAGKTLTKFLIDNAPNAMLFHEYMTATFEQVKVASGMKHPRIAAFGEMVSNLWGDGLK